MPLWSYPGIVTGPVCGPLLTAQLDLGCNLLHPAVIRLAGINPRTGSAVEGQLQALLPEGTPFVATTANLTGAQPVRAHLSLAGGGDVASRLKRHLHAPAPTAVYGGTLTKVWRYPAVVERVCDGDTTVFRTDLGCGTTVLRAHVRVAHVNAPEHGTAEGDAATVWAENILTPGAEVTLTSHKLDKYGRMLADITGTFGDYGQALIAAGHAVAYEGGPR